MSRSVRSSTALRPVYSTIHRNISAQQIPVPWFLNTSSSLHLRWQTAAATTLCLHQQQRHESTTPLSSQPTSSSAASNDIKQPAQAAHLRSRRLISLAGPDAAHYLHGAITRSIYDNVTSPPQTSHLHHPTTTSTPSTNKPPRTSAIYAAFLNSNGRVLHDVFIWPDLLAVGGRAATDATAAAGPGHAFLVDVDAAEAERLAKRITLYKLRARFTVRVLRDEEATVWQAWESAEKCEWQKRRLDAAALTKDCLVAVDSRAPGMGLRSIVPQRTMNAPSGEGGEDIGIRVPEPLFKAWRASTNTSTNGQNGTLRVVDELAYSLWRYKLGVAEGQAEILRDKALPQESNIDLMGGIDFRKGCYMGQELTVRTQHRGVVRKRILPVKLSTRVAAEVTPSIRNATDLSEFAFAQNIPCETEIGRLSKQGRNVGKFLRGIGNVGLALCRLEAMTNVQIPGAQPANVVAAVAAGAAKSDEPVDEFCMRLAGGGGENGQWESGVPIIGEVLVRARVPDWLRQGLAVAVRPDAATQ